MRFSRDGVVSFSEYHWFTPLEPGTAGSVAGARDATHDHLVTLNLPLVGVLAAIDAGAGGFKQLAELAVEQFVAHEAAADSFQGLFMRRCGPCTPFAPGALYVLLVTDCTHQLPCWRDESEQKWQPAFAVDHLP